MDILCTAGLDAMNYMFIEMQHLKIILIFHNPDLQFRSNHQVGAILKEAAHTVNVTSQSLPPDKSSHRMDCKLGFSDAMLNGGQSCNRNFFIQTKFISIKREKSAVKLFSFFLMCSNYLAPWEGVLSFSLFKFVLIACVLI